MLATTTETNGTARRVTPGWARGPRIRPLKSREQATVLARNNVGRIAFHGDGRIELLPIHYVYAEGVIVGRTSVGMKYLNWLTRDQVVFEVDESSGLFDWKSVVVRGTLTLLRPRGSSDERRAYAAAVEAYRSLVPAAFTREDPTPYRGIMFAIRPIEVTGRVAST
jgi:nitroimidazol reductase NimA-like FMN-containing flavoprotein (pyridoxamine 5'-phosphate oxidase superfamily)